MNEEIIKAVQLLKEKTQEVVIWIKINPGDILPHKRVTWAGWVKVKWWFIDRWRLRRLGMTGAMHYNKRLKCYEYCSVESDEIMERLIAEFPGFWPGCFTGIYCDGSQLPRYKQKYWHVGSSPKYWPRKG